VRKTKTTRAEFDRIFVTWVERLELLHWDFKLVLDADTRPDADAHVAIADDYYRAKIEFDKDWPKWSPELLNRNIVHELMHCHLERLWGATQMVKSFASRPVWEMHENRALHELESAVDAIAHALVVNWGNA
jgi:hypothetical protein